jgi:hypothetical protein
MISTLEVYNLMITEPTIVELLVNPFCMAHRDVDSISNICNQQGVELTIYNLWEIDDDQLDEIPGYIASLIREWRSGTRPGSVYSSVFVNGKRIPLNAWKEHLKTVSDAIVKSQQEGDA